MILTRVRRSNCIGGKFGSTGFEAVHAVFAK